VTILTAEDPRTESLEDILAEMADAATSAGEGKAALSSVFQTAVKQSGRRCRWRDRVIW